MSEPDHSDPIVSPPVKEADKLRSSRSEAFKALAAQAGRFLDTKSKPTLAGLKPALKLAHPEFDESTLEYDSFTEFVNAAVAAGAVQTFGEKVERMVIPSDRDQSEISTAPSRTKRRKAGRMRPDLWAAFVDWNPNAKRFYDPVNDIAWIDGGSAHAPAPPHDTLARFDKDQSGFIEISPIQKATLEGWMSDFLDSHASLDPRFEDLRTLGPSAVSVSKFSAAMRSCDLDTRQTWGVYRSELVAETIEDWASTNAIRISISHRKQPTTALHPQVAAEQRPVASELEWLSQIRAKAHTAIDRMPAHEILRLPIPLEFTLDLH